MNRTFQISSFLIGIGAISRIFPYLDNFDQPNNNYPKKNIIKKIAIGIIAGMGSYLLNKTLGKVLSKNSKKFQIEFTKHNNLISSRSNTITHLLFSLFACTVSPFFEEKLFRNLMLSSQIKTMSKIKAVVLNGLHFGLCHIIDHKDEHPLIGLYSISSISLSGMIFATSALLSKDLWISTTAHIVNNFLISAL